MNILDSPTEKTSEFRFALRGLARSDKDFYASQILQMIMQDRLQAREGKSAFVRQDVRFLQGYYVFGVSQWNVQGIERENGLIAMPVINGYQNNFLKEPVKQNEFDKARAAFVSQSTQKDMMNAWLDADTFKLASVKDDLQNAQNVALADVQRVLDKLRKEAVAYVLVLTAEKKSASK